MNWDWVATTAGWFLWAVMLAVLLIGLNSALPGLAWCSLRSLWRLNRARYVARRIAPSERIICDGDRLCYSPRARSSPPKLYFARNVAGWARGVLTPKACADLARDEISRRSIVLGMVVSALAFAWIIMLLFNPGVSGGPIFAALVLLSALFIGHTIYPFRLSTFSRLGLSWRRAKGSAADLLSQDDSTKSAEKRGSRSEFADDFIGSQETIDDLDRFYPLQRHALGSRHESVFVGRYYRSLALFHLGRHDAALADIANYGNAQRTAFGERNFWTLKVRYLKAVNLAMLGQWPAALDELEAVAPLQIDVLGAGHPDTLMSRSSRVKAWAMLERYAEALEELDTLLPECERVFGPDDPFTSSNLRLRGIALQKLEGAPKAPATNATAAVSAEPSKATKPSPPKRSAAPIAPAPRKPADALSALAQRLPTGGRLTPYAGAAFLGLLSIGGGIYAANLAQRESSKSNLPKMMAEPSPPAPHATPISLSEQTVPQTLAIGLEDQNEDAAPTTEEPTGPSVEHYAASMIAGRNGAKVRETPSRDAPLIVRVAAGSPLRVTGRTEDSDDKQWFRVVLPDRRSGFVREDVVVRDSDAVEDYAPASPMAAGRAGANVRSAPRTGAPLIARLDAGSDLRITGRQRASDHTWFRVVVRGGRVGFVRDDVVESVRSP